MIVLRVVAEEEAVAEVRATPVEILDISSVIVPRVVPAAVVVGTGHATSVVSLDTSPVIVLREERAVEAAVAAADPDASNVGPRTTGRVNAPREVVVVVSAVVVVVVVNGTWPTSSATTATSSATWPQGVQPPPR